MNKKTLKNFFEKNASALAVPAILIVIGLFFVCYPDSAVSITVKVIGVAFVVVGVVLACTLLAAYSPFTLAISIITAVFGIVCIALPGVIASFVIKVLGLVVLVNSLLRLHDAYMIKGKSDHFIEFIINDIITLILGIVLVVMPLHAAKVFVIIIGVVMIILGISNLITVVRVYIDGRYVDDGSDVVWEE